MNDTNSILEDIRQSVGLSKDSVDFDTDLMMHINSSISTLRQNGIGKATMVSDTSSTWGDLKDPEQDNEHFQMIPLFITMNTKFIFDPPPPSAVEFYSQHIDQLLWRLKVAYEEFPETTTTTTLY